MDGRCSTCHTPYPGGERFCPLDGGAILPAEADADPRIGQTIDGRYFVRRLLGRGGMGAVYEADHVGLDKRVAIKFLIGDHVDRDAMSRFRREARAASRITHDHVVQIFDVGSSADGSDFIAMEYLEGCDLHQLVKRDGPLEPDRAIALARQLLAGLQAIHDGGVVHRDIKPANVLVLERHGSEHVKIMDFGISKATRGERGAPVTETGQVIGTPQYMAPEQIAGGEVDGRSDIYSVGVTLYAIVTGAPPFADTAFTQLAARHLLDRAPSLAEARAGLPPALVDAVARALEKRPADRFASARAFADALGGIAPGPARVTDARAPTVPRTVDPASAPTLDERPARRPVARWPRAALVGLGLAGAAVLIVVVARSRDTAVATVVDAGVPIADSPPPPLDAARPRPNVVDAELMKRFPWLDLPALDLGLAPAAQQRLDAFAAALVQHPIDPVRVDAAAWIEHVVTRARALDPGVSLVWLDIDRLSPDGVAHLDTAIDGSRLDLGFAMSRCERASDARKRQPCAFLVRITSDGIAVVQHHRDLTRKVKAGKPVPRCSPIAAWKRGIEIGASPSMGDATIEYDASEDDLEWRIVIGETFDPDAVLQDSKFSSSFADACPAAR